MLWVVEAPPHFSGNPPQGLFENDNTSEMECDSIYYKIKKKEKSVLVYVSKMWAQVIRCAQKIPNPLRYKDYAKQ